MSDLEQSAGPRQLPFCGCLHAAARLYVRAAGPARLDTPRRWLGELPSRSLYVGLKADGVVFELVHADSNDPILDLEPAEPSAAQADQWIEAVSAFACFGERGSNDETMASGERRKVEGGSRIAADSPLWLVADEPVFTLNLGAGASRRSDCAPVGAGLTVSCSKTAMVRAVTSLEILDERGPTAVAEAADHLAEAIAAWFLAESEADRVRRADVAEIDETRYATARRQILGAASSVDSLASASAADDPTLAAIEVVGRQLGFAVLKPASYDMGLPLDRRLERIAMASNIRVRAVSLDGRWWREEGPPMAVLKPGTRHLTAAIWRHGRFHLVDAATGKLQPVDTEIASGVARRAYVFHASLPNVVDRRRLGRFALHGTGGDIVSMLATGMMAAIISLIVPIATGAVVSRALPEGRPALVVEMAVFVAAAAIGTAAFAIGRSLATIRASSLIDSRLQAAIWDRVLKLPPRFFRRFSTGDMVQRLLAVDAIRRLLTGPVLGGLLSGLFASFSLVLMLFYDVRLAIYGFGFAAVSGLLLFLLARRQLVHLRTLMDAQGHVTGRATELVEGISKLRVAAAEERSFAQWASEFTIQQEARWRSGRLVAAQTTVTAALPSIGILGMFYVASGRSPAVDLAAFAAFNAAFGQFIAAFSTLAIAMGSALQTIPLLDRLKAILDEVPEIDRALTDPGSLTGRIAVRGLSFSYDADEAPVLEDVAFAVEPGEFVALVGPSGGGKSTLLRLLLGFEKPSSGAIFYDEQNLAKLDPRLVRRQIGTVLQNASLIPGTLYENIAGGTPVAFDEVMEAVRQAGLEDDVRNMPMGLETFVSERASTISGGQRQRVMIARALLRRPPIFFLDEATSALGNRIQAAVSENIERLHATRIVIAHRLSTVRNADRILVIERGHIVEEGTFDELMARRGALYRLAQRQIA